MLLFSVTFSACSSGDDDQEAKEKGAVDQITDKVAEKAVKKIRSPLDKARSVQGITDERERAINQATEH